MIDLKEATASIKFYTSRLDMACEQYAFAVGLEGGDKAEKDIEPRLASIKEKAVADLKGLQRDTLALRILIDQEIEREVDRLLELPEDLAGLMEAKNRNMLAIEKTGKLLGEHEKEAEKRQNASGQAGRPSEIILALREFIKKNQQDPEARRRRNEFKRKYLGGVSEKSDESLTQPSEVERPD
jgi:hypothetical protein